MPRRPPPRRRHPHTDRRTMAGLVHGSIDMDPLERKFLTSNVMKDDDDDDLRGHDSGDDAVDGGGDAERAPGYDPVVEAIAASKPRDDKSMLSLHRPGASTNNTGPKGVKADYAEWKEYRQVERAQQEATRTALIDRLCSGAKTDTPSISYAAEQARARDLRRVAAAAAAAEGSDSDDDEDLGMLDDEDFMDAYRQRRRQEIAQRSQLPSFGKVRHLDAMGFLDRVEASNPKVCMVVHLCEDGLQACRAVDAGLESIAREHIHTDFVRLRKSDTPSGLPCSALPSLLVYRGGELVASVMGVAEKIGEKCSKEDLEWLLVEEGVIGESTGLGGDGGN